MTESRVEVPGGVIAITTHGTMETQTAQCLLDLRRHLDKIGLGDVIEFIWVHEALADKARNEACHQMLATPSWQWIWMLDADMTFAPTIADSIFRTAFAECQWAGIVGGYAQLKSPPYLPTLDLGSGLWESVMANSGPKEVIRTGGACLLIKRPVLERMAPPWFGIRQPPSPLTALAEVDGYARQRFDGRNPFRDLPQWDQLQRCAEEDHIRLRGGAASVGEDSNFTDAAKALGFRIVVDTNAVCGHISRKVIGPADHQEALNRAETAHLARHGVLV